MGKSRPGHHQLIQRSFPDETRKASGLERLPEYVLKVGDGGRRIAIPGIGPA